MLNDIKAYLTVSNKQLSNIVLLLACNSSTLCTMLYNNWWNIIKCFIPIKNKIKYSLFEIVTLVPSHANRSLELRQQTVVLCQDSFNMHEWSWNSWIFLSSLFHMTQAFGRKQVVSQLPFSRQSFSVCVCLISVLSYAQTYTRASESTTEGSNQTQD